MWGLPMGSFILRDLQVPEKPHSVYDTYRAVQTCSEYFTIEDPVEKNLRRVNNQAGLTFEIGLRALLRQDPDIIMVGETRDVETASISVRSAITGHLVFSTLHTNDASSSIIRLEDMGLQSYMVANSLVGSLPEAYEEDMSRLRGGDDSHCGGAADLGPEIKRSCLKGCPQCNYTG
ncbi:MAG: GspE/PulE family protein [Blautia marasmi]